MRARTMPLLLATWLVATPCAGRSQARPSAGVDPVPLPEHPRPDFMRLDWLTLNGPWGFRLDPDDAGLEAGWAREGLPTPRTILVPFPWGSPLSGVPDSADIGWYEREVEVPAGWAGRRVFLVVGASDWRTTAWLDGRELGTHEGGYVPFELELPDLAPGRTHRLVLRVDDAPRPFRLEGKQGYGDARGIWQTPYLDARGETPLASIRFTPDLAGERVDVRARLLEPAPEPLSLTLAFPNGEAERVTHRIETGAREVAFEVDLPDPRLWSLEDPYLHEVEARVSGAGAVGDLVRTYFGMREIGVVTLPGTDIPWVSLNGEPVYLQLALDQGYHPDGYYTFPSDAVVRDEILRARRIGLNGLREHVKIETPRKLYWADRLGMLIMADVPNSWGRPDAAMRAEVEGALEAMIERDYNHPSIFAWVPFNETWGLFTRKGDGDVYAAETQRWVVSVYRRAKALDPTRLVEDNSVCCGRGHTETDLDSWHAYLPGWEWREHLASIADSLAAGTSWNFEPGYRRAGQPNLNSEFGNVWGYEGSTGDVDWSWDYHRAVDAFRRHPEVAGWLYTEHHDVINEWNGYWRADRTEKETGLGELVPGMSLRDLHAPFYVVVGDSLSRSVRPGERVVVPLFASFLTGTRAHGERLTLRSELVGWDELGRRHTWSEAERDVPVRPWLTEELEPLAVTMPDHPASAVLAIRLEDAAGTVLHRNFTTFVVEGPARDEVLLDGRRARLVRFAPDAFAHQSWSLKQWSVMDGAKVNGAGAGFFEYRVPWPTGLDVADVESVTLLAELSAKELFGKDREGAARIEGDFMRGRGTHDPGGNANAYPMTDQTPFPSAVTVRVNGVPAGRSSLADDPADHRGILSWHHQARDRRLREAGSYGELVRIALPREAVEAAAAAGELVIRFEVDPSLPGGLALYGSRFGRFPLDPSLVFVERRRAPR